MGNNNTIDGPEYYRLADGTFLEDALWEVWAGMPPAMWDACCYEYRAGHKDGESEEKDLAKVNHDLEFFIRQTGFSNFLVCRMMDEILGQVYKRHGNPWEASR